MMWKDEGYMASGEKLVSLSLNAFGHASKVFNDASRASNDGPKSIRSCVQNVQLCVRSIQCAFSKGALFSKWHVYNTSWFTNNRLPIVSDLL